MSFAGLLNEPVLIKRRIATQSTSSGGAKFPVTTVATTTARIQSATSAEASSNGRLATSEQFTGFFFYSEDIRTGDYIESLQSGREFEVAGPPLDRAGNQHHWEVPLLEARPHL